jgi:ribosomal protein S18 acetylase RimI-like enzyme
MVSGLPGKQPDIAWLLSMYVSPAARHRGIGSLLVDAVERWAVRRGAEALWLEVVAANRPAIRLYERHGLVVVGEVPSDDPGDPLELYMSKPLRTR